MNNNEEINVFWKNIDQIGEKLNILNKKNENSNDETNILKLQIEDVMKTKNYSQLENIAASINELHKKIHTKEFIEFMKGLSLSIRERLLFYLKIYECKSTLKEIKYVEISMIMAEFINDNKEVFLNLLDDEEILNLFSVWFKNERFLIDDIEDDYLLESILKIPKIQEDVLKDPSYYIRCNSFKLFKSIPKECAASIVFYSHYLLDDFETELEELYSKHFGDTLDKKEQLYLVKEQIIELKKEDIFGLGLVKMLPFYHLLNCILEDKKYYTYVDNMQKNSKLDFGVILKFFYKYNKAPFFQKMCKKEGDYSIDTIKKIDYLALENRLLNSDNIEDLDMVTLEEIKKLPKEKGDSIKLNVYGGPSGMEGITFEDGYKREIRRIDRDGSVKIFDASSENHENAVKEIYPEIQFNENCVMAIERAVEAVKQLSSITFIIENEACYVVSSDNLSEEQINSLNDLKIVDENKAKFGIITYDIVEDNYKIAYNGESVSFDKLIEYMNSLNIKNKVI